MGFDATTTTTTTTTATAVATTIKTFAFYQSIVTVATLRFADSGPIVFVDVDRSGLLAI